MMKKMTMSSRLMIRYIFLPKFGHYCRIPARTAGIGPVWRERLEAVLCRDPGQNSRNPAILLLYSRQNGRNPATAARLCRILAPASFRRPTLLSKSDNTCRIPAIGYQNSEPSTVDSGYQQTSMFNSGKFP